MENPNEQKTAGLMVESGKNTDGSIPGGTKLKWGLAFGGVALAMSVALNFGFYFGKIQPEKATVPPLAPPAVSLVPPVVPPQTEIATPPPADSGVIASESELFHKIDKKISNGGVTWLGISAMPNENDVPVNYELWRVDENNKKLLIKNFPLSVCDTISWDLNNKGGIDLLYATSPCEAFVVNTRIVYDARGVEQFRLQHDSSAGQFKFKQDGKLEYEVSLLVEGVCEGNLMESSAESALPEVLLEGVRIVSMRGENETTLAKPAKISCGVGYGGVIINPIVKEPIFDEEKIEFTLPNDRKAIISLKPDNYTAVEFK